MRLVFSPCLAVLSAGIPLFMTAQDVPPSPGHRLCVIDPTGAVMPGVRVAVPSRPSAVTGPDGCIALDTSAGTVTLRSSGFSDLQLDVTGPTDPLQVTLQPATVQNIHVLVTTDRGLAGITDTAASIAVLTQEQLAADPGLTLDDSLHQVAGFKLYRRTSSWTANPTTEGVSLRGLGSTAASRTAIVSDQVPLADPFGGWVHWNEIPSLALAQVSLQRGGASDLYGSGAIGGAIDLQPVEPSSPPHLLVAADGVGAQENTGLGDLLLTSSTQHLGLLAAGSGLSTGGYITTAPSVRGPIDRPSNVASESGRLELRTLGSPLTAFLRGNVLNELRSNGTPLTPNATRLWRYQSGLDLDRSTTHAALRLFGSRETYRQQFSSVNTARTAETLTKLQRVPTDELGFSALASHTFPHHLTAAAGADLRDIRSTDAETAPSTGITTAISARQRETGGYLDGIWQPRGWSVSASVRIDNFRTFDGKQIVSSTQAITPEPQINELIASPRVGLVRNLPHGLALTAEAFRAFRGPTLNELYRTSQIGQQITGANPSLLAERATGIESGLDWTARPGHLRAVGFWTEVNRPISAVVLSQTATTETLQRQNLGQIRSRGLMLEGESRPWLTRAGELDLTFGYQLAIATVTAFNTSSPAQANLTGLWIPEVPRNAATANLHWNAARIADFHLFTSYTGREYDDSNNAYILHPYARFDLSAERSLTHGFTLTVGAQNLLNRSIDAARTPLLTLAAPRLVEGGLRYVFSR